MLHTEFLRKRITIYQCPQHKSSKSLCIEDDAGGVLILGGKCCVNQYKTELARFYLKPDDIGEMITQLEFAIEDLGETR